MNKDADRTEATSDRFPIWVWLLLVGVTILIVSVTYYQTGSVLACVAAVVCEFIIAGIHSLNVLFDRDSS